MSYTTTGHHFDEVNVQSVHRKWPHRDEVAVLLEANVTGGRHGDEITFHCSSLNAKRLCKDLLNIIGNDSAFHQELDQMMRVQRTPE